MPIGAKENYAFAEGWNVFLNINEELVIEDGDNKCEAPQIAYADGKLTFSSSTPGATYFYSITCDDVKDNLTETDGNVQLCASYTITAYATAEGYDNSAPSQATLHWINATLGSGDGVQDIPQKRAVVVSAQGNTLRVSGLNDGEQVALYNIDGQLLDSQHAAGTQALLRGQRGKVVIVKLGEQSIKVKM